MARIVVQTDNHRTVLEEDGVGVADISSEDSNGGGLLARLERALRDADTNRLARKAPVRRLAVLVPTSYRDLGG